MGAGGLLHAESLWMGLPSRRAVCCQRCSFLCHLPMLCEIERILDVEAWSAQGHLTSSAGTQPDPDLLSYLSGAPQTAPPSPHFASLRAYRCLQMTLFAVQQKYSTLKSFWGMPSYPWIRNNDTDCGAKIERVCHWNNSKSYFCGKHPHDKSSHFRCP